MTRGQRRNWKFFYEHVQHMSKEQWDEWGFGDLAEKPKYAAQVLSTYRCRMRVQARVDAYRKSRDRRT